MVKFLQHSWPVLLKILLPLCLIIILLAGAFYFFAIPFLESRMMEQKRLMIQDLNQTAQSILHYYHQKEQQGLLSREEAREKAIEHLRQLRYGPENKDYFWINDMHPNMIMHPYRPDLEGQDISDFTDPTGKRLFSEFVKVVRQSGSGFVDYQWQWKDDPENIVPKISYVKAFEPWGWITGTGVYIEDIREEIATVRRRVLWAGAGLLIFSLFLAGIIFRESARLDLARDQALEELKTSEERYRMLFESANDAVFVLDKDRFVHCNKKTLELFRVSDKEIHGMQLKQFSSPQQEQEKFTADHLKQLLQLAREGQPQKFEWKFTNSKNEELDCEVSLNLLDWHEEEDFLIAIVRDVTARKRAENERNFLENQLRQSEKMKAVGELAGGVAHDFNNLLQAIIGYGEIAWERLENLPDAQEDVDQLLKAAHRAKILVRQLLAFSRRQVLQLVVLETDLVIDETAGMIRRVIGEHIRLIVQSSSQPCFIRADRGQIEQVLMNLCVNARDAMPVGGEIRIDTQKVEIEETYIESHPWVQPGSYVQISVSDNGCGMRREIQERIFEPFFSTKETGKGTGLGLSTVYGIVRQHEGMINVYSEENEGTTFKIYLPSAEKSNKETSESQEILPGGSETILIAEDNEEVRRLARQHLEKAGYTVLSAAHGKQAISIFEEAVGKIDMAMLDVIMPEMGGQAVFEYFRSVKPELPILFASGYSPNAIHTDFVLHSGLELIQKPYSRKALLKKVRSILDNSKP